MSISALFPEPEDSLHPSIFTACNGSRRPRGSLDLPVGGRDAAALDDHVAVLHSDVVGRRRRGVYDDDAVLVAVERDVDEITVTAAAAD